MGFNRGHALQDTYLKRHPGPSYGTPCVSIFAAFVLLNEVSKRKDNQGMNSLKLEFISAEV